jgi:hypothetical protein
MQNPFSNLQRPNERLAGLLTLTLLMVVGCSPAARQNAAGILAAAGAGATGNTRTTQRKLMLFGGHDHRTYLGLPELL